MKRILLAAIAALLAVAAARAQGVRYDNIVLGPRGAPVGAATVAVCAAGAATGSTPCSPLSTIYADEALTQPVANPLRADSLGNYGFWAAPGHYVVQIYGTGLATRAMDIFLPCDPSNCSMSAVSFSSITAGSLNLTGSLTVNGRGVATKPLPGDAVLYVSANGNDANDGLSWGTAKLTLYAAVSAIQASSPGGGTVYVGANVSCGGPVSGQGLWLVGPGDPSYNTPPSGWIQVSHPMQLIGVGVDGTTVQNAVKPGVNLNCGSAGDNPPLWITGTNTFKQIAISNLIFASAANNALKIGISTSDSRTTTNTTGLVFDGDSFSVNNSGAVGPTLDVGSNTFWVWFKNCAFAANSNAPALSDAHQAVVINPTSASSQSSGLFFFDHIVTYFGGIRFYGDSNNAGSLYVHDLTMESSTDGSPAVGINVASGLGTTGLFRLSEIGVADATVNPTYAVQVQGADPSTVVVSDAYGSVQNTSGPMTVLSQYSNNIQNETATPYVKGQWGFQSGRIWAQDDNARRTFAPVASRFTNLAKDLPSAWTVDYGTPNISSVAAPDGTSNAGQISGGSSGSGVWPALVSQALHNGDYIIGGMWVRNATGSGGNPSGVAYNLSVSGCSPGPDSSVTETPLLPGADPAGPGKGFIQMGASGEWEWFGFVNKLSMVGSQTCYLSMLLNAGANQTMQAYGPVLYYVPAGTVTDSEAAYIAMTLTPYPDSVSPPVEATLRGHPFAFGGSGDNYFAILDHTALTANQTFTLPNSSGTLPNFSGSPAANDCVKWGSNGQLADSGSACGSLTGGHLTQSAANGDLAGTIAISAATSASHTFSTAYSSAPACVASPTSNPGSATWWVTTSTTAVTVNLSASATLTFNYVCAGNPN